MKIIKILFVLFILHVFIILVIGMRDKQEKSEVAIVFGNEVKENKELSSRLKARLDEVIKLYNLNLFKFVIVTGGIDKNKNDEAFYMREYLNKQGIPNEVIIVDNFGINTYKSVENIGILMEKYNFKKVMIITQYFHIPRIIMMLKMSGINETNHSYAKKFFEIRDIYSIFREVFAIYYWFFRILIV